MLHSQARRSNSELAHRTVVRVSVVLGLLAVSILALATGSLHSAAADSSRPRAVAERSKHRISMRGSVSAPKSAVTSTRLVAPLLTIDVDRTDDDPLASTCTAAANDCSLRGAVAFANLAPGTVINVPAGNYQLNISGAGEGFSGNNSIGDLDISGNNTSIVGAGAASTIITQTSAGNRVIEINPFLDASFTTSISGVTISGGTETTGVGGGGIISGSIGNNLTISNSIFSGNSATGAGTFGGGGICHTGGNLTIHGSTFSNNSTSTSGGGVSYSAGDPLGRFPSSGTLSVSGSTFTSNTANSAAAGGGALDLFDFNLSTGVYNVGSSRFSSNTAANANGGAIVVESGGPLTVTTSSFSSNSAGNSGGAIHAGGSSGSVTYSRLVGNTVPTATNGVTLFTNSNSFTAEDNWWGINTGPSANDFRTPTGTILPLAYLQLRASASPNEICAGESSTVTADIKQRNVGAPLTTELNGLPAFPVPPAAIFNNAVLGTISGASTQFVDGVATATFTAGTNQGMGSVDATADNQTVTATISISGNQTTDPADVSVCQGQDANFSTTASGPGPFTYAWTLDGSPTGGNTPSVTVDTTSLSVGSHTVAVTVTGACGMVSQTATLTVQTPTATTDPADVAACQGEDANFSTTASGTGPFSYAWTLDGNPFNGNNPSITIPTGSLSPGNHTVQVTTTGACGNAVQTATLTVGGTPVITLSTNTISVWPPNHQYQTFNVTDFVASASSTCDPTVDINDVKILKVSSDEPENSAGADGNTVNDIVIADDCKSVQLRRERDSNLNGRVYTITFKVTDSFGNSTTATATVTVPLNQNGGGAVDDGPAAGYTVNSLCP